PRWFSVDGPEPPQLSVLNPGTQHERRDCPDEREEHVPLRIPWVALGPEKRLRGGAGGERRPPLDEFVEGADGHTEGENDKGEPAASLERRLPDQNLTADERRDEPLRKVPDPVVVVAGEPERLLHPEAQRNPGVGVLASDHQNAGVNRNESVHQRREPKPSVR